MKNKIHIFIVALFIIGIAFIFNTLTTYLKRQSTISKYEQTKAVVVEVIKNADSTSTHPILQFRTIDNQKVRYRAIREKALYDLSKGDTVLLYYDLINPQMMYIPQAGNNTDLTLISLLGFIFCAPALIFLFFRIRNVSILKKWRVQGKKIKANVVSIEALPQHKTLGFTPSIVTCESTQNNLNGHNQQYKSPLIWTDLGNLVSVHQTVDVYVDVTDNKKYVIDLIALQHSISLFYVQS
jgi:hypothetical protein